jgi:hypothetical protein
MLVFNQTSLNLSYHHYRIILMNFNEMSNITQILLTWNKSIFKFKNMFVKV